MKWWCMEYTLRESVNDGAWNAPYGMGVVRGTHPTCDYLMPYPGGDAAAQAIIVDAALENVGCRAAILGADGTADGHVGRAGKLAIAKQPTIA